MCGCGSQDFMGSAMPNQNVYDVGPGQLNSPMMFGTDSMNPLGANPISSTPLQMVNPTYGELEESASHEMSEPKGPMGEDID